MPFRARVLLLRLACLLALSVSTYLYVTTIWHAPALGGLLPVCDLRLLGVAKVFGVPVSLLGALAYGGLLGLTLFPVWRLGRWVVPLAVVGGGIGVGLLLLQFVIFNRYCPFCVVVDAAAILAAVAAVAGSVPPEGVRAPSRLARGLWLTAGLAAIVLPAALWMSRPPVPPQAVPAEVVARWQPGVVTVVEVINFRSHPCRHAHAALEEALHDGPAVNHVIVPWAPDETSRVYARAFHAAEKLGKGKEMAAALFAADFTRFQDAFLEKLEGSQASALPLTPEDCVKVAEEVGLSPEAYEAALADPDIDRRIDDDVRWITDASPGPLPVFWVQDQFKFGELPPDGFRDALRLAEEGLAK
jgi:uncharacterized membrane protein